jgi:hypothetical protein
MPDERRSDERDERDDLDALLAAAFEDEPVPALSPAFEARLRSRLEAGSDPARHRLPARARGLLVAYWIAAAAASVLVVAGLDPGVLAQVAGLPWVPIGLALALTAAGLALPLRALRRGRSAYL